MNYEKIGEFIAKKRKEKNLTQKDLALLIGVTDKAVSKWERGLGCPDVSILEILSSYLGVSILEILKGRMIENEVIKVTELNDYVLDTVEYSKETTKNKFKNFISNLITIIIFGICSFLLIVNVHHILYLNRNIANTLTKDNIISLNENINKIKTNIDIINSNQGIYNIEDYTKIKEDLDNMYNQMTNMELLKYDIGDKITVNDLHTIDQTLPNSFLILSCYKLLENYSDYASGYAKLYEYSYISRVFSSTSNIYSTYKYQILNYTDELVSVDIDVYSRVYQTLYIQEELLTLTENIMEVGGINE